MRRYYISCAFYIILLKRCVELMPDKMEIRIKTLTPLWTGGINTDCDCLHETGIIGSLRWWHEAVVRGMGYYACDPSTHSCSDKYTNKICSTCLIYGSTGYKKAFRFEIDNVKNESQKDCLKVYVNANKGWFLKHGIMTEDVVGRFLILLRPNVIPDLSNAEVKQMILLTLRLASNWGGLGARTQHGYGVFNFSTKGYVFVLEKAFSGFKKCNKYATQKSQEVRINNGNRQNIDVSEINSSNIKYNSRNSINAINGKEEEISLARIDEFFFCKVRFSVSEPLKWIKSNFKKSEENSEMEVSFKNSNELRWYVAENILPVSPMLRYHLRSWIRNNWSGNYSFRHKIMGNVKNVSREKSLINVSHAYLLEDNIYEMRIWGEVPYSLPDKVTREEFITSLKLFLGVENPLNGELWKSNKCSLNVKSIVWCEKQSGQSSEEFIRTLCE